ncbi:unnamed protein product [Auanema sp. JU1783]|nr:unnamed protein product [Auanema sp. JU1783]
MVIKSPYTSVPEPTLPFHEIVLERVRRHALEGKNKIAFIDGHNSRDQLTYKQLYEYSLSLATFLRQQGFEKDVCCFVLPNMWQYAVGFLGVTRAGGVVSGASALFTDHELQRQFVDSRAKAVFTTEALLPKVLKAVKESPNVKTIIVVPKPKDSSLPSEVFNFNDIIKKPADPNLPKSKIDIKKDLVMLPYSSGTTGPPKGVMLTHLNYSMMLNIYTSHDAKYNTPILDSNWDYERETFILLLPFYHVYGFGLLTVNLLMGSCGIIFSHFDPVSFCTAIQDHRVRMLPLVPPIMVFLAKSPLCNNYDLSSVEFVICGAAPAGRDLCEELSAKYKNIKYIQQGYGMTESSMASHIPDLKGGQPFGSVGKLASNLEMKITNVESGKEVKLGERGEICIRGPTVMAGYLGRPDATKSTVIDNWLHTGDIGYVDNDGNLFIVDRLKELIKVKGLQVAPAELEDLLLSHPRIRDAAVIGVPDAKAGELPRAYVVRADDKLTQDEVKEFVKSKVSHYKQLAGGVEFLDEIPKSAAGKILRRLLKDKAVKSKL